MSYRSRRSYADRYNSTTMWGVALILVGTTMLLLGTMVGASMATSGQTSFFSDTRPEFYTKCAALPYTKVTRVGVRTTLALSERMVCVMPTDSLPVLAR